MRGRLLPTLLATAAAALAVVGCGGDDALAPEAPGTPDMRVPEAAESPAAGGNDDSANQDDANQDDAEGGDATPDPDATAAPDDGGGAAAPEATADPNAAVPDDGGGAVAPEAEADSPTNDTEPPAGSEPEQFEDFCAQNPGAC